MWLWVLFTHCTLLQVLFYIPWFGTDGYLGLLLPFYGLQHQAAILTSDINKACLSTQLPLAGYFLFLGPFSANPRDGYNSVTVAVAQQSDTNNNATFRVT